MNKELYKQECYRQLHQHFERLKKQQVDEASKNRVLGFIHAGEFLDIITRDEASKLLDDAHFEVFAITKEQRLARKSRIKSARGDDDYSFFDTPTVDRVKLKS